MIISATNLKKVHGDRVILDDVSIGLRPGKMCALIGVNGAGKSTLLRILAGLERADSGSVRYGDDDADAMSPRGLARARAYVAQSSGQLFDYSVLEVVMMGEHARSSRFALPGRAARERALAHLERFEMRDYSARSITSLSGGELQRVMLARAFAAQTPWLMLDEPTASLDVRHRIQVLRQVRERCDRDGIGALIVLHDLELVERFFDRVLLLDKGRVICDDAPERALTPALLSSVYGISMNHVPAGAHRLWFADDA